MDQAFVPLAVFSAVSFLCYGVSCLRSAHMEQEFKRFGLDRQRRLTGVLQLMGAVGLVLGFWVPPLGALAAAGLSLLMLLGLGVRLKIKDRILQWSPALFYALLNLLLCVGYVRTL